MCWRCCFDVDMIVRVIADRMPRCRDFAQPIDRRLLQYAPYTKEVNHASALFRNSRRFDCVFLGWFVEIPLLVVPLGNTPLGILGTHFQVERNCNESLCV